MDKSWTTDGSTVRYDVHLGTWTNQSRGRVLVATLTLSRMDGNLLIEFTAVFVRLVSSRFWRIACVIFHRYYSNPKPCDGLHHQRYAALRNSANPISGFWAISQICWAWRQPSKHPLLRTLPLVVAAVLCIFAFATTSGFSSSILTGIGN